MPKGSAEDKPSVSPQAVALGDDGFVDVKAAGVEDFLGCCAQLWYWSRIG